MKIQNCSFYNLSSSTGGALFLSESDSNKNSSIKFSILSSKFLNCNASFGGAVYLYNIEKFSISQNTSFLNNSAVDSGGAIYFYCDNYGLDIT